MQSVAHPLHPLMTLAHFHLTDVPQPRIPFPNLARYAQHLALLLVYAGFIGPSGAAPCMPLPRAIPHPILPKFRALPPRCTKLPPKRFQEFQVAPQTVSYPLLRHCRGPTFFGPTPSIASGPVFLVQQSAGPVCGSRPLRAHLYQSLSTYRVAPFLYTKRRRPPPGGSERSVLEPSHHGKPLCLLALS